MRFPEDRQSHYDGSSSWSLQPIFHRIAAMSWEGPDIMNASINVTRSAQGKLNLHTSECTHLIHSDSMLLLGLNLAHWTTVPSATVRANTTAAALLAIRPLAIVRANAAATTLPAKRPLAIVRANATATTIFAQRSLAIMEANATPTALLA